MNYDGLDNVSPKIPAQQSNIFPLTVVGEPALNDNSLQIFSDLFKLFNGIAPTTVTSNCWVSGGSLAADNEVILTFANPIVFNKFLLYPCAPELGRVPQGLEVFTSDSGVEDIAAASLATWTSRYIVPDNSVFTGITESVHTFVLDTPVYAIKFKFAPDTNGSAVGNISVHIDERFDPTVSLVGSSVVTLPYANVDLAAYYKAAEVDVLINSSNKPRTSTIFQPGTIEILTGKDVWRAPISCNLYYASAFIEVYGAGVGTVKLRLRQNGTEIGSLIELTEENPSVDLQLFDISLAKDDALTLDIVEVPDVYAGSQLSVILYYGDLPLSSITVD